MSGVIRWMVGRSSGKTSVAAVYIIINCNITKETASLSSYSQKWHSTNINSLPISYLYCLKISTLQGYKLITTFATVAYSFKQGFTVILGGRILGVDLEGK